MQDSLNLPSFGASTEMGKLLKEANSRKTRMDISFLQVPSHIIHNHHFFGPSLLPSSQFESVHLLQSRLSHIHHHLVLLTLLLVPVPTRQQAGHHVLHQYPASRLHSPPRDCLELPGVTSKSQRSDNTHICHQSSCHTLHPTRPTPSWRSAMWRPGRSGSAPATPTSCTRTR